jgi:AcrR family transcriptional regulator
MASNTGTDIDPRIERTRKVVLDATADLVADIGFDNMTIEGVSERCGVARSTIYRHWPGKDELLIEAIKGRMITPPAIDTGSLRSDVMEFLSDLAGWFGTKDGVMMALSLLVSAHRDESVAGLHREATRTRRTYLIDVIQRGIDRGELPSDLDCTEAANDLVGALFYKKMVVHEDVDQEYVEARADRWLSQVGWTPASG